MVEHSGRTGSRLEELRSAGRAALISFLPAGFPDLDTSVAAARTAVEAGVDIVELGLPYSDPVMDGPVIQRAAQQALGGGTRTKQVLHAVEQVAAAGAPVVVMTYWNPVLRYGVDAFARDLASAGGAGLITPDLVPDEADEWIAASDAHGLDRIFLVAPSSSPERLAMTAKACRGFVYAASTMGVTGVRASVGDAAQRLVHDTRQAGAERVCVGLGVSNPEQAAEVGAYADGVIVGSAFVKALDEQGLDGVTQLAGDLAAGVARSRAAAATDSTAGTGETSG
ncbi:MAG TPA: tryptophan synthase subunit alpha [Nocardioidaceae bacterium]|nr:tryptophan synthase subunit alpha [Nocardioidaceae bacterium]